VDSYLNWVAKTTGGKAAIQSAKVGFEELPTGVQGTAQYLASGISTADTQGCDNNC
jgi:hypothetical protein